MSITQESYHFPVGNFRDVGEFLNAIAKRNIFPEKRLYRGGAIGHVEDPARIGSPKTIFSFRNGPDPEFPEIANYHFPRQDNGESYFTTLPGVRKWLRDIAGTIGKGVGFPLYLHCFAGRDRTGVVVAALLKICAIPDAVIVEEYRLSDGAEDTAMIRDSLKGLDPLADYFRGIDLEKVRSELLGSNT